MLPWSNLQQFQADFGPRPSLWANLRRRVPRRLGKNHLRGSITFQYSPPNRQGGLPLAGCDAGGTIASAPEQFGTGGCRENLFCATGGRSGMSSAVRTRRGVVTGAASGIGRAVVARMLREGVEVLAVDIDAGKLAVLASD
jgi:hypothetical protein